METIIVALVVGMIGPFLLKKMDWRREDEVANRLLEANKTSVKLARDTKRQLNIVHVLVNSNMTTSIQGELDATKRELAMMRENVRLNRLLDIEPSDEMLELVAQTEEHIYELTAKLQDRLTQAKLAEEAEYADQEEVREEEAR